MLAVLHRRTRNGENHGGAMYYMKDFFESKKKTFGGIIYTFIFTALCLVNGFTMGAIIQSNAIAKSFETTTKMDAVFIGIILAILSVIVFIFNGKKVFSLCEKLVPLVSILYIAMSLIVIFKSYERVPKVFAEILKDAFTISSISGGGVGFLISNALRYGTIRGLFSNEAGCGTSPIAHSTSNTNSSCEQGFLGVIEVFIDTIIICTITALVILLNKDISFEFINEPMQMVLMAFSSSLGNISGILLTISIFLFAFATIICWGYYGKECIYFVSKNKSAENIFYFVYIITVFIGAFIKLDFIWQLGDFAIGMMTLLNLFILGKMSNEVRKETFMYYKNRASIKKP